MSPCAPSEDDAPALAAAAPREWGQAVLAMLRPRAAPTGSLVHIAHPLLCVVRRGARRVLVAHAAVWSQGVDLLAPFQVSLQNGEALAVLIGALPEAHVDGGRPGLSGLLPSTPSPLELWVSVSTAFELMEARSRAESRGKWLNRYRYELGELIEIARAIEKERDIDRLLGLILEKSRLITGADAGSIYVAESDSETGDRLLRFKLSQNGSVGWDSHEFTIPVSSRSMAGAAALAREPINIVDAYDLDPALPFAFDRSFDEKTGYRTKSILCLPLIARSHEVIGVIQLINKKRDPDRTLHSAGEVAELVVPFDERSQELLATLGAQAGISLENAMLLEEIRRIFEGFVRASIEAIEQRDPTTSGHSRRVSQLTVDLARAVERVETGPYREVTFSREDLREIEYASLLHDFGKIGVREQVLVKARKLYEPELELIHQRLELAVRSLEVEVLSRKLSATGRGATARELEALDAELLERRGELERAWALIQSANEPTVLNEGDFSRVEALAGCTYAALSGEARPLLTASEVTSLSTTRGSLTSPEIEEIRSHVVHTYNFLARIPWGKSFRRVPLIAGAHHEKLNGTGYPNQLRGEQIPVQAKIMSIADIFDALTANDRPYKRAVPADRALDILGYEVKAQHLDGELVRIFREAEIWRLIVQR